MEDVEELPSKEVEVSMLVPSVEHDKSLSPKMEGDSGDGLRGLEGDGRPAALLVRLFELADLAEADCNEVLASCLSRSA